MAKSTLQPKTIPAIPFLLLDRSDLLARYKTDPLADILTNGLGYFHTYGHVSRSSTFSAELIVFVDYDNSCYVLKNRHGILPPKGTKVDLARLLVDLKTYHPGGNFMAQQKMSRSGGFASAANYLGSMAPIVEKNEELTQKLLNDIFEDYSKSL